MYNGIINIYKEKGFTSHDAVRLDIIRKMQKNSARTVLLADTSKVGKKYMYKGFGFESIDYVVMEKQPEDQGLVKTLGRKLLTTEWIYKLGE